MKLTVQTLKNTVATLEVDPDVDTFDVIRRKVIHQFNYPEESQIVLIHQTKIISKTTDVISSVPSIKDGDRIVIMKKSTPAKPATTPSQPPPAGPPPVEAPLVVSTPQESQPTEAPTDSNANTLLVGGQAQSAVAELVAMGFERPAVARAMRAAFNNPNRAAEYLMNGIPDTPQSETAPTMPAAENAPTGLTESEFAAAPGEGPEQPEGGAASQQDLIAVLRHAARVNPQMLPGLLQVLGTQNPALLSLIQEHPDQFMQMLMADAGSAPGEPQQATDGRISVSLTEEEIGAVTRLEEMGFPRDAAIQAYLACDKDENSAANFLFDSGNDFRGQE